MFDEDLAIILATRGRYVKFHRMVDSLASGLEGVKARIMVAFDGDPSSFEMTAKNLPQIEGYLIEKQSGSVWCRNFLSRMTQGRTLSVFSIVDDITFKPGSIRIGFDSLKSHFPDLDGVVGFTITGSGQHPSGTPILGSKFMDRYPERNYLFPGYYHFAAQEIGDLASRFGKFHFEKRAVIYHYHPGTHPKEMDQTHRDGRIFKDRDQKIREARKKAGLIWGM